MDKRLHLEIKQDKRGKYMMNVLLNGDVILKTPSSYNDVLPVREIARAIEGAAVVFTKDSV